VTKSLSVGPSQKMKSSAVFNGATPRYLHLIQGAEVIVFQPSLQLVGLEAFKGRLAQAVGILASFHDHHLLRRKFGQETGRLGGNNHLALVETDFIKLAIKAIPEGCNPNSGSSKRRMSGIVSSGCRRAVTSARARIEPSDSWCPPNSWSGCGPSSAEESWLGPEHPVEE